MGGGELSGYWSQGAGLKGPAKHAKHAKGHLGRLAVLHLGALEAHVRRELKPEYT